MWSIRQAISIIRFGFPYLIRAIFSGMGLALQLSVLHIVALIKGIPQVARKVGEDWAAEAVAQGLFPSLHERFLAEVLTAVAVLAIFIGYIINIFTAAFIVIFAYLLITKL